MIENVLLIGGGGREHALAWKLAKSPKVGRIFVSPGNGGVEDVGKTQCCEIRLPDKDSHNYQDVVDFCRRQDVNLVVVGPEEHLDRGIGDFLSKNGIRCFGPNAKAAMIESSKAFSKEFMRRHGIPTARFEKFTSSELAIKHIRSAPYNALVVKASGLAAGKGVVVAKSIEEACIAVADALDRKLFGDAGAEIVVEELLQGEEISALCFTDGLSVKLMPLAQDHKRLLDHDEGPNTGGMGAYAPCPTSESTKRFIEDQILAKTVQKLREDGLIFKGVLYAGVMMTEDGPKVLEYNCRFGDPETQILLPLLKSDLFDILSSCVDEQLDRVNVEWFSYRSACGIVMSSGGYPNKFESGYVIHGLEAAKNCENVFVFHAGTRKNEKKEFVTNGGRVLCVMGFGSNIMDARSKAGYAVAMVDFKDSHHRHDIGAKAIKMSTLVNEHQNGLTYSASGVSIDAGESLVRGIKKMCGATSRSGSSIHEFGGFGGMFDLKEAGYVDPILVSGTDGVGTKLKIAQELGMHSSIGVDLVAMCVNDILVHNAEPLFFLDYFATGRLNVEVAKDVISGIAAGCKEAGCVLIGGETAEMPGFYDSSEYDVAGFAVGALDRSHLKLPSKERIKVGDVVLGLPSSGVHSNGFSLVRKVVEGVAKLKYSDTCPWNASKSIGNELLTPTKIYVKCLLPLLRRELIHAVAHITGGGLLDNIPRVLPKHLSVRLDAMKWHMPESFKWIARLGRVNPMEMARTLNCGIGMVLIVPEANVDVVKTTLAVINEHVYEIGSVFAHQNELPSGVDILNLEHVFLPFSPMKTQPKIRVGVLISGSGTNLQSLINHTKDLTTNSQCKIAIVISNIHDVQGLDRAQKADIPTKVISHKGKQRETFDSEIDAVLREFDVQLVCLAGFMRILSEKFVRAWKGKMLNIHPSLLPSFKGAHAHQLVLEAGVRLSGCTVHFVETEVDAGGIILQDSVVVFPNDTVDTLSERVKLAEHRTYPKAMELVARGDVALNENGKVTWRDGAQEVLH